MNREKQIKVQVWDSSERLVFEGTYDQLRKFQRNDSDRLVFLN